MIRRVGIALALIAAAFFIVRAIVELLTIDYSDPSSYANDWGGPSLGGVLRSTAASGSSPRSGSSSGGADGVPRRQMNAIDPSERAVSRRGSCCYSSSSFAAESSSRRDCCT